METDTAVGAGVRVTVSRDDLSSRLALVSRATSTRGTVQVLGGILLRASDGLVELEATDMELSLRTTVPAEVEGEGSLVIPARLLGDIVKLLPAESVTLSYRPEDGVAAIESGSYSSRVNVFAAEDFPRLPSIDVPLQEVGAASLLETVQRVSRAASRDESRPVLTGILVRFEGSQLTMAATDSYRMAVKETELEASGPELEAIIPARALDELGRVAAGAESVQLGVHENHVIFGAGSAWLTTRRIDGQFPNVSQLRPETFDVELELPRGELLEAVRRAAVLAQRNTPAPASLRRGRADDLRPEPGRGRDEGVAAGGLHGRAARDRLQRGVPPRRPRVGAGGHRPAPADQSTPAGPPERGGRCLLVPDHADQARRIARPEAGLAG